MSADQQQGKLYGLLAEVKDPKGLLHACAHLRDAGFEHWDAHTPFPIHGMEEAMGLQRSKVPLLVLVLGLSGAALGMLMQWWVATEAYPLVISGKPLFSWPAFVPIMFECGVLGGAIGAIGGFLALSRLPQHHHALFSSERFEGVTDDRFFVSVESSDSRFDMEKTTQLLEEAGATHIEKIFEAA